MQDVKTMIYLPLRPLVRERAAYQCWDTESVSVRLALAIAVANLYSERDVQSIWSAQSSGSKAVGSRMLSSGALLSYVHRKAGIVLLARGCGQGGRSVTVGINGGCATWSRCGSGEGSGGRGCGFADDGVVAGRHGGVVCSGGLLLHFAVFVALGRAVRLTVTSVRSRWAWITVEDLEECLVGVMI